MLSPDGFAERFDTCSQTLWCIAVAIVRDRHQAEDVLQEAAVVALGKLADFDPETSFPAWMGQIVRYVALNHARRRASLRAVTLEPDVCTAAPAAGDEGPAVLSDGTLASDQLSFDDAVLRALDELDDTARACLLLRVVLGLPYRDVAQALDIREGTAMSHVHRSRRTLSERLASEHCDTVRRRTP